MPDEVVRLPKVSRATGPARSREIVRPVRQDLLGIHAERPHPDSREDAFFVSTRLAAMTRGEEVTMFHFTNDRSTNAFADLEAQLRALGASGDRLAEATTSLRASARTFAAASARLSASSSRLRSRRPVLKLV